MSCCFLLVAASASAPALASATHHLFAFSAPTKAGYSHECPSFDNLPQTHLQAYAAAAAAARTHTHNHNHTQPLSPGPAGSGFRARPQSFHLEATASTRLDSFRHGTPRQHPQAQAVPILPRPQPPGPWEFPRRPPCPCRPRPQATPPKRPTPVSSASFVPSSALWLPASPPSSTLHSPARTRPNSSPLRIEPRTSTSA